MEPKGKIVQWIELSKKFEIELKIIRSALGKRPKTALKRQKKGAQK